MYSTSFEREGRGSLIAIPVIMGEWGGGLALIGGWWVFRLVAVVVMGGRGGWCVSGHDGGGPGGAAQGPKRGRRLCGER
jgi:hypothetical protein